MQLVCLCETLPIAFRFLANFSSGMTEPGGALNMADGGSIHSFATTGWGKNWPAIMQSWRICARDLC